MQKMETEGWEAMIAEDMRFCFGTRSSHKALKWRRQVYEAIENGYALLQEVSGNGYGEVVR